MTTKTSFGRCACPSDTPWGMPQEKIECLPGIWWVSTAGHGGYYLSPQREDAMPTYLQKGCWYEEDCDWALVHLAFPELNDHEHFQGKNIAEAVKKTVRDWHPSAYEKHFNCNIKPGESYKRDRELFGKRNRNRWVVVSAFGDWHKACPKGMVLVCATKGGKRLATKDGYWPEERWFHVPVAEYQPPFVIDCRRHKRIEAPEGH